jgi:ubiquinone/menaquinone biosynthesis C-methylase UbiE
MRYDQIFQSPIVRGGWTAVDNQPGEVPASDQPSLRDFYHRQYGAFAEDVYRAVRQDIYGEEFGQSNWQTVEEYAQFLAWMDLDPTAQVLDVACGSGGPALRLARLAGCHVVGIDFQTEGIATARAAAAQAGLTAQATFEQHDATRPLPFPDASFDAVVCIDAINHLPDRPAVLREWWRVLKPGGRLVFTDPIVVTGPLTDEEIATRAAVYFFLFVPPEYDDRVLADAGFMVASREDTTANVARIADRWHGARTAREAALRAIEGDERYDAIQAFFTLCAHVAREGRLSRFAYLARKPVSTV